MTTTMALPSGPEAVTADWLTQALRQGGTLGDAAVTSFQMEPIGQGVGILCRLARLTLEYDRDVPGAPRSVVAKLPTNDPQTRGMVSLFRFYERETRFYSDLRDSVGLPSPRAHFSAYDPASGDF